MSKYTQKKLAIINDLSGYGRCSLTVALPIISALKVQCCPVPTSILSNHTGFATYSFFDFTKEMPSYIDNWKKLNLTFDGIATGFLGSKEQIEFVIDFFKYFKQKNTMIIVDPVMGDHGKSYTTYTPQMCEAMKELVKYADILTPNVTEACILTDTPYKDKWTTKELIQLASELSKQGPKKVVITGIPQKTLLANLCFEVDCDPSFIKTYKVGSQRPGTGDIFSSIIAADALHNISFKNSVKKASLFIKKCIQKSIELETPLSEGVCFEELLHTLK
ncbi:MAG: pyridoxamine kinase [Lachnospiraceae bacterium]